MSRDFILVFSGGMVSLITTLVVLFVADYIYRREQKTAQTTSQLSTNEQSVELALPEKLASESADSSQEQVHEDR